jgi:hypothetical protein
MKKLQEPTISFIISYAMVPNDLSGFVGLLLHCPPLSLKKVRFWKLINLGMELEKKSNGSIYACSVCFQLGEPGTDR